MGNSDQKTQINKAEVIHDLNNLNYLLRAMAKMIDSVPGLPIEVKRLSLGAITATDKLIAKIDGRPIKTPDNTSSENNQYTSKNLQEINK